MGVTLGCAVFQKRHLITVGNVKRWSGHNLQVSVWEPRVTRYGGLGAINQMKGQ